MTTPSKPICDNCGRPSWKSHGGMGGHIMPDYDENCIHHRGAQCRTAAVSKRLAEEKAQIEIDRLKKELADMDEERYRLSCALDNALFDLDQARTQLGDYYE